MPRDALNPAARIINPVQDRVVAPALQCSNARWDKYFIDRLARMLIRSDQIRLHGSDLISNRSQAKSWILSDTRYV
jgi:hypothetical protein